MTISISGTVYSDEGITPDLSGPTLNVSVNGAASAAATTASVVDGTYTLSGITAAAGAVLTVYLQGNTPVGCVVTTSTGSSMTSIDIYENDLVLRSDNGIALTGTNLNTADNNGASGISSIYASSSNTVCTLASGKNLLIAAGQTLALVGGGAALSVTGNFTNRGTFTMGSATVTLKGTGAQKLTSNGSSFGGLTINGSGGTYTLQDALVVTRTLTLTAGTLDVSVSNFPVTIGPTFPNWTVTAGVFTARSGTVTFTGTGSKITGSTTFFNLVKTVTATDTLTFFNGTTQTVTNAITLQGAPGQLLSLVGASPGTPYTIAMPRAQKLSYLSVTDCTATVQPAAATNSVGVSGNTAWTFGPPGVLGVAMREVAAIRQRRD